jgi:hypothetical protein
LSQEQAQEEKRGASAVDKAAYSMAAQDRLSEAEVRLAGVKARICSATSAGHVVITRQLEDARRAVDANLEAAKANLERLKNTSDAGWKEQSRDFDTAWEDLSGSIGRLVACYSDGKK